ncbi:MAG: YitT family protein [Streptococcaceae bacterium]|nr:YitT family protein [Streptococcaceae bacterium]MCH4176063.1 YitT family protein [Streptococcaceae bacterium]
MKKEKSLIRNLFLVTLGIAIYSFGFTKFNMENHLAEGGIAGITLIGKALFDINPAYSNFILNVPLVIISMKVLGKKSLFFTAYGISCLSVFMYVWQKVPIYVDVSHDMLIAALLAGVSAGVGGGLVFRGGGIVGGGDIIARLAQHWFGISLGKILLCIDAFVLCLSLLYIDIQHMMYTLIASFVFSRVVEFVQSGGYTVRGMLIISSKYEQIANEVMYTLQRGVTYINGEGAYSKQDKKIIYVVLNPREIHEVKRKIETIDPKAFVSIINVHEVLGEGFSFEAFQKNKQKVKRKIKQSRIEEAKQLDKSQN